MKNETFHQGYLYQVQLVPLTTSSPKLSVEVSNLIKIESFFFRIGCFKTPCCHNCIYGESAVKERTTDWWFSSLKNSSFEFEVVDRSRRLIKFEGRFNQPANGSSWCLDFKLQVVSKYGKLKHGRISSVICKKQYIWQNKDTFLLIGP